MTTITILQKTISNQNLIAVPRNVFEEFLIWEKITKSKKSFKPTSSEKREISRGRREISKGEYMTLEKLTYELANQNRQRRNKKS